MKEQLKKLAHIVGHKLKEKGLRVVTAESCTGGGLAYWFTEIAGSSDWFDRGFITYQDLAKQQLLQVTDNALQQYGAVSEEVALQMARGALKQSQAQISIATTGIAGPSGATANKPVGLVWIAWITPHQTKVEQFIFAGDRQAVREQTIAQALEMLLQLLD
jgi:nicotinamide-nucleotide amidase